MQLYNSMHLPSEPHPCQAQAPLEFGLKALNLDLKKNTPHKNCSMMLSDLLSPTSSSLLSGDYIGMESSVDVQKDCEKDQVVPNDDEEEEEEGQSGNFRQRLMGRREQKWAMRNKEFPPPIPLLARTENLPSHMPWVLKRHYTSDGRLILTEEKVRHHEYFRAHRSNGRLTLQLVPLDDEVLISPVACDEGNKDGNGNDNEYDDQDPQCDDHGDHDDEEYDEGKKDGNGNGNENEYDDQDPQCDDHGDHDDEEYDEDIDGDDDDGYVDDDDHVVEDQSISGNIGGSAAGKCFNFNSVGTGSPCIFGVPVPAIRQVHS
ncbi:hypothetical protein PRUPE_1G510900 [Prunus persica]|uniref:FAF domain-containing protein n=1 Tax=Prunus persica TaxID=3760 RepID=M5XST0_PRUPE|nr:sarcoplasmic reticulum histidine-rich calcium-binding protein [Prunus persica]ONI35024.1 hypothetical protein PRUPE_1G510900 [Prunus persica]